MFRHMCRLVSLIKEKKKKNGGMRAAACRSSCFIDGGDVSAALVLGLILLFDLLSLEDVQYLSVQFPHYSASELVQLSFFFFLSLGD